MGNAHGRTPSLAVIAAAIAALFALAGPAAAPLAAQESGKGSPELFDEPDEEEDEGRKMYSLGVRGGAWFAALDAELDLPVDFDLGPIEASGDLDADLEDEALVPYGEVFLELRWIEIRADFWWLRVDDDTRADADFEFEDTTFQANVPVRTKIEIMAGGAWIHLNPLALELLELGVILGARYFWAEAEISQAIAGEQISERRTLEFPLPQAGASLTIFIGERLDIYAQVVGIYFEWDDYDVRQLEGEAGLAFNITRNIAIGAEYRVFLVDLEKEDEGDFRGIIHGPLAYLRLRL